MLLVRAFGSPEIEGCPTEAAARVLAQPKRFALLVYLLLAEPRRLQRRDKLLPLFWPDRGESAARNALSVALHFLREHLGDAVFQARGTQEVGVDGILECDVLVFEQHRRHERWEEAHVAYRGDLLDGFFIGGAPQFNDWLDRERQRLRRRASEVAMRLAAQRGSEGAAGAAGSYARHAVDLSSMNEEVLRAALTLFVALGDRAGALRLYADFARRVEAELGLQPAPETEALVAAIRGTAES
jgi:DNA-binding SARP family transcriptional activator